MEAKVIALTRREAAAVLDLLRVMPDHIALDDSQMRLVQQLRRRLRQVI